MKSLEERKTLAPPTTNNTIAETLSTSKCRCCLLKLMTYLRSDLRYPLEIAKGLPFSHRNSRSDWQAILMASPKASYRRGPRTHSELYCSRGMWKIPQKGRAVNSDC